MNRKLLKAKVKELTGDRALIPQIARVCEVSEPTVHNWLSGKTKMPIDAIPQIQRAFDFSDDEILDIFVRDYER
jgi:DNA-binding transcriptional regulator YdaS (Cro superfamily)